MFVHKKTKSDMIGGPFFIYIDIGTVFFLSESGMNVMKHVMLTSV